MDTSKKIISVETLKGLRTRLHRKGKKIAWTNGCFDILHLGHIKYLEKAKKDHRVLVVGVNSDASVKKIKGAKRPILGQRDRAHIVASLACVDYVTIFNESTPLKRIQMLKPDIVIKGADYKNKEVVGRREVKAWGGRTELIKFIPGYSTTRLLKLISKKCKP